MNRSELLEALGSARACLSAQDIVPILSHFCFTEDEIIAFNGTQGIIVDFESELSCGLPGELLIKLLSSYKADKLTFALKGSDLNIKAGKSKVDLVTLPDSDFLFEVPDTDDLPSFDITEDFLNGIKSCLLSVGKNPLVRNQFGVTLKSSKKAASLYSTDNHRVSRYTLEESLGKKSVELLLPDAFCQMLIDIGKNEDEGELFIGEDFVVAVFDEISLYSKLLPDVDLLDFEKTIGAFWDGDDDDFQEIPKNLESSLNRCLLFTEKNQEQIVKLDADDETLSISTTGGYGNVKEEIEFDEDLDEVSCRMDVKHIIEMLPAVEEIALGAGNGSSSVMVGQTDNFFHLLLSFPEED